MLRSATCVAMPREARQEWAKVRRQAIVTAGSEVLQ